MSKFYAMKPVQFGIKAFAIGTACTAIGYAYNRISKYYRGPEDACVDILSKHVDRKSAHELFLLDSDAVHLLNRLEMFERFDKNEFKTLFRAFYVASKFRKDAYEKEGGLNATDSFLIRKEYQNVIESVRLLRKSLEKQIPSSLEDFDEVASDINAKVEQECTDAIQDTFIN